MLVVASIIQAAAFILYTGYVVKRFGILSNISESWEALGPKENYLFTLFLLLIGVPMFFQSNGGCAYFTLSGAGFVYTALSMRSSYLREYRSHYAGIAAGILGCLAGLWVEDGFWVPSAVLFCLIAMIKYSNLKNKIWWVEVAAFLSIIQGLFYR